MPLTEKEALIALSEAFEFEYVCIHPRILNCVPDAIVFDLDHFDLRGFEVKTTRSDWLQEKRSSYKNRHAIECCDFWSIIADHEVAVVTDLPPRWGLYRVVDRKLICAVEPSRLKTIDKIDRPLAASLLRVVRYSVPESERIEQVRRKAYSEAVRNMAESGFDLLKTDPSRDWPPEAVLYGEDYKNRLLHDPKLGPAMSAQPEYLDALVRRAMEKFLERGLNTL